MRVADLKWFQAQPPAQHQGNQGMQGDLSANPYFQVRTYKRIGQCPFFQARTQIESFFINSFSLCSFCSIWLRTTATWCTRTWPTRGNKVLHLPQVKQQGNKKIPCSWNLFRRQARVWKPEGLESRWSWTFLVLEAPPTSYDWLPPHLTFQQIKTTIFFNCVNPTNHIMTINPFLLAPVQLLFVLCLDLDLYPF